jgi:hypothetical protein
VDGSTTLRQTATAADTLEIDVPTRHQRDVERAAVGGGHSAIVPRMSPRVATRGEFLS